MPTVIYQDSDGVDRSFELGADPVVMGRAEDCHVRSGDGRLSRHHARMSFDGSQVWIEDLGSVNGVYVGGERVQRGVVPPSELVLVGSLVMFVNPPPGGQAMPGWSAGATASQLIGCLAQERKARAEVEAERDNLGRRVFELHEQHKTAGPTAAEVEYLAAGLRRAREEAGAAQREIETLRAELARAGAGGGE